MNLNFYQINYDHSPYEVWNSLKTNPPVDSSNYDSLFQFCKDTSRYHFDNSVNDLQLIGTDISPVIPICRFIGDWDADVQDLYSQSQPATFNNRSKPRRNITNNFEENDFRRWGYDIDGGYAINNRTIVKNGKVDPDDVIDRKETKPFIKKIQDMFHLLPPLAVKLDVQKPGQCFYWHIDNFGGLLRKARKDYDHLFAGDLDQRKLIRFIVFLDDQQTGHHWQQGNLLLKWKRGDCITWPWRDVPHGTANYGHTNRPTLNITGIATDKTMEFFKYAAKQNHINI